MFIGFNSSVSAIWLVDLERVCSLLIGHCLGDMLLGSPVTTEEIQLGAWLENKIFSNGLHQSESNYHYILSVKNTSYILKDFVSILELINAEVSCSTLNTVATFNSDSFVVEDVSCNMLRGIGK